MNIAERAAFAEQVKQKVRQLEGKNTHASLARMIGIDKRQVGGILRGEKVADQAVDKVVAHFGLDVDTTVRISDGDCLDRFGPEVAPALRMWGDLIAPLSDELRERLMQEVWLYLYREIRQAEGAAPPHSVDLAKGRDLTGT